MKRRSLIISVFGSLLMTILFVSPLFRSASVAKAADPDTSSYVRVIHASPFVGTADIFVDGKLLLSSFQFAAVSDYVAVPPGSHDVKVSLVGKGINAAVLTQKLTVPSNKVLTVAALGTEPQKLSVQVFEDDNQVVPNQARVRVYHLAPDAGNVEVQVGEEYKFNNVGYTVASQYMNEDTGPCEMSVNDTEYNKSLKITASLRPNTITSIFAVGLFRGNPKIQLVEAQTQGIPGLPGTGGDPYARPADDFSFSLWAWSFGGLLLTATGGYILWSRKVRRA